MSDFRLNDCFYNPARPDRGVLVGFMSSTDRVYSLHSTTCLPHSTWAPVPRQTNVMGGGSYDDLYATNMPLTASFNVTIGVPAQ